MMLLPAALLRQVERDVRESYPEECCGLLIGFRDGTDWVRVTEVAPSRNIAASRCDRFEIDPALRFALTRRLRGTTQIIVGHYHSHPDGPAHPSLHDAASAFEPELMWLIVAADRGTPGAAAVFAYDCETGFRSVSLMISA